MIATDVVAVVIITIAVFLFVREQARKRLVRQGIENCRKHSMSVVWGEPGSLAHLPEFVHGNMDDFAQCGVYVGPIFLIGTIDEALRFGTEGLCWRCAALANSEAQAIIALGHNPPSN